MKDFDLESELASAFATMTAAELDKQTIEAMYKYITQYIDLRDCIREAINGK